MLASSAHLTRTAHHNNPVDNFEIAQNVYEKYPIFQSTNGHLDQPMGNGEVAALETIKCSGCEKSMEKSYEASKYISI